MITPELITYIKKQLAAKVPVQEIVKALAPNGWSSEDIKQAFVEAAGSALTTSLAAANPRQSSFAGRKILLSLGLVCASAAYAFYQVVINPPQTPATIAVVQTPDQNQPVNTPAQTIPSTPVTEPTQSQTTDTATNQTPAASAPPPQTAVIPTPSPTQVQTTQTQTAVAPTPAPAPVQTQTGQYKDGTYTGGSANAYYGNVQVQAVIQNGALANIQILQYPNTHSTSVYINEQAIPTLVSEAVQAQSANVDMVSGATFTSQAFQQSLGSALAQAQN